MPSSLQLHGINRINHITSGSARVAAKQAKPTWVSPFSSEIPLPENAWRHHTHAVDSNQCCSAVVQTIYAPLDTVWSVVRRFDKPQAYKHFLKSCDVILGHGEVGSLREVRVVSGLPAVSSTERLEIMDDEKHVLSFSIVGGDHRLHNYRSVTTLHAAPLHPPRGGGGSVVTVVVESYVVDVPQGNTKEETRAFVDTIVRCNLQSLAQISEKSAKNQALTADGSSGTDICGVIQVLDDVKNHFLDLSSEAHSAPPDIHMSGARGGRQVETFSAVILHNFSRSAPNLGRSAFREVGRLKFSEKPSD